MTAATRREFVAAILSGAAGLTVAWPAFAQNGTPAPITATKLTDRIAALSGAGGNVGLLTGADGLLMIDGGTSNRAAELAKAIADISPRMVQVLFNTHYHFDHVGSNELLGGNGARIVAQVNVKARVSTRFENPAMGRTMEPLSAPGLPKETFDASGRLMFGDEPLEFTHVPLAHTDGDSFVFFPRANVLHTGDLLWVGRYPVVDYTVGGSLAGMAKALDQLDKVGDVRTRIICGHGPGNVGKAEMRQVREMWVAINQRLETLAKQGKSIEDVIAASPTKDFDAALGVTNAQPFLRQAYGGVLARQNG